MHPGLRQFLRLLFCVCASGLFTGATAFADGNPFAAPGELQVTLQPASAVTAGAGWRLPGEAEFHSSSEKISAAPGTYLLEFRTLAAFPSPPAQAVAVRSGVLTTATAAYDAPTGSLPALMPDLHLSTGGGIGVMKQLPDGRVLIGGFFSSVNGVPRRNLARLEADGTLDLTWNPAPDGGVDELVVDGDFVFVGGAFGNIGGAVRNGVAKVSLAGSGGCELSWDPAFKPQYGPSTRGVRGTAYPEVLRMVRNDQGLFLVRMLQFLFQAREETVLKLDPQTGATDQRWSAQFKAALGAEANNVRGLAEGAGSIYVTHGDKSGNLVRLSPATGRRDRTWKPPLGAASFLRTDANYLYALLGNDVAQSLVRFPLTGTGTQDAGFNPGLTKPRSLSNVDGGFIYVLDDVGLERVPTAGGGVDPDWRVPLFTLPIVPDTLIAFTATPNGVLVPAEPGFAIDSVTSAIARYSLTGGGIDPLFRTEIAASFGNNFAVAVTPAGDVLLNSNDDLVRVAGQRVGNLPRFHADGSLDLQWNVEATFEGRTDVASVDDVVVDDGYAYVAGFFDSLNGIQRFGLARLRLDGDGTPDPTWNPIIPEVRYTVHRQLIHRGALYVVINLLDFGTQEVLKFPLNGGGDLDPDWNSGLQDFQLEYREIADFGINCLVGAGDGLYIGGGFRGRDTNGKSFVRGVLRLRCDGAGGVDPNFVAPPRQITTNVAQVPPEILADVGYTGSRKRILHEQAGPQLMATDGVNLYAAIATFPTAPPVFVKYSVATGAIDSQWQPQVNSFVDSLGAANGFVYIGGEFTRVNGVRRDSVARVSPNGAGEVDPMWDFSVFGRVTTLIPFHDDMFVAGQIVTVAGLPRANFALLPTLDPPVIQPLADQPAAFSIQRNVLDGVHVTHFQLTGVTGGAVRLISTGDIARIGDFVLAEDAARGFTFEPAPGSSDPQSVTAVAALGEGITVPDAPSTTYALDVQVRPPIFQFGTAQYFIREGAGVVTLTVLKTGAGSGSIGFTTADASALAVNANGGDYVPNAGRLDFAAGDTSKTIDVQIADDAIFHGDRRFMVKLSAPSSGAVLGEPSNATVNIIEDDAFGTIGSSLSRSGAIALPAATSSIAVQIAPAESHGQWRLAGELDWRASGSTAAGLTAGNYVVEFSPVADFLEPPPQTIAVADAAAVNETAVYQPYSGGPAGSLQVVLKPDVLANAATDPHAQWRLQSEDETQWRDSGATRVLSGGVYVIEFRTLAGYVTPPLQRAEVSAGITRVIPASYLVADGATGQAAQPVSTADAAGTEPYIYNGQIRSSVGYGSGAVTHERVVLTAAHVLFDDVGLSQAEDVVWLPQKIRGVYEPQPVKPRGWFIFEGYASQRRIDDSPGVSTPASQELDAAAMFFAGPASRGQFGGYVAAVSSPGEFLVSPRMKMLAGYPVEGVTGNLKGVLHATAPANLAFAAAGTSVFSTHDAYSFPGASGGPVYVQADNGAYYPAGIYLGGTGETLVRAIDHGISDLLNRADAAAHGGGNNTGGGITVTSASSSEGNVSLVQVKCVLSPAAAVQNGARWRLAGETSYRRSGDTTTVPFGSRTIEFAPASGFVAPPPIPFTLAGGSQALATGVYTLPSLKPEIVGNLQKTGLLNESFSYQIPATQNPTSYAVTGDLPPGVTLDARTGLIAGVPTVSGSSELLVSATNAAGASAPRTLRISILRTGSLNVQVAGAGSITPGFLGSTTRVVGQRLSITATPAPGNVFKGWSGDLPTTEQRLVFTMPEVLFLSAEFVLSPFADGVYNGYARGPHGAASVRMTLSSAGSFSLTARMRGQMYSARGVLTAAGSFDGSLKGPGGALTAMHLQLDVTGGTDLLTGQIAPAGEALDLVAARADAFTDAHPAPAGSYTLALPRDVARASEAGCPQGDGYATLRVDARGGIVFKGALGDGSAANGAASLAPGGIWYFVLPGSTANPTTIAGPITFAPDGTLSGNLLWAKPQVKARRFQAGFSGAVAAVGSSFETPNLQPNSSLVIGGVSGLTLTKTATLNGDNTFAIQPAAGDALKLSIDPATGALSGSFRSSTNALIGVNGVVLPKQQAAYGLFLQPAQTGYLELTHP